MKNITPENKLTLQFLLAIVVAIVGLALLIIGIFTPPQGVIDSSVLVAWGEISTFVASILGMDYHYKAKVYIDKKNGITSFNNTDKKEKENEQQEL